MQQALETAAARGKPALGGARHIVSGVDSFVSRRMLAERAPACNASAPSTRRRASPLMGQRHCARDAPLGGTDVGFGTFELLCMGRD